MTSKNAEAGRQPVTDCNRLGNAAKMREALSELLEIVCMDCKQSYTVDGKCVKCPRVVAAESAIATPPRNCDVGTYEEQSERFTKFCGSQDCKSTCPFSDDYDSYRCEFAWAQMPYEEGEAK